ncbi:hypothetical protein V6N13_031860 [Hibiscus sabdariffa]|uniref:Uncharacterized protein n=1 Tax=Hibiscus sabdariffa TaxID=183260 RepID=A0ABR2ND60_9ROSI
MFPALHCSSPHSCDLSVPYDAIRDGVGSFTLHQSMGGRTSELERGAESRRWPFKKVKASGEPCCELNFTFEEAAHVKPVNQINNATSIFFSTPMEG